MFHASNFEKLDYLNVTLDIKKDYKMKFQTVL